METALVQSNGSAIGAELERVLISGDLSKLTPEQRVEYYNATCQSLGLNPLTRPFEYITLNGKLTLYTRKDCTDQLRRIYGISFDPNVQKEVIEGVLTITVVARTVDGRTDTDMGAVSIAGLKGDALANATMKCMTKAKRRVTLSLAGLGLTDESELETIPGATERSDRRKLAAVEPVKQDASELTVAEQVAAVVKEIEETPDDKLAELQLKLGERKAAMPKAVKDAASAAYTKRFSGGAK